MLPSANESCLFSVENMTTVLERRLTNFRNASAHSFVLVPTFANESTTTTLLSANFFENTEKIAMRFIFLLIFFEKSRSLLGPCVTPPPFHNGDRIEPCRARPVPFCFHGFLPPPRTSLRPLACAHGSRLF